MLFAIPSASFGCINAMLHQTFLFLGQLWQLFEVSQILEFLRYPVLEQVLLLTCKTAKMIIVEFVQNVGADEEAHNELPHLDLHYLPSSL